MSAPASIWPQMVRLEEVARARETPLRRRLVADEAARAAIAKALDLVALHRLEADLTVKPWFDGVEIHGRWSAEVEQICGVSLDPFTTPLKGSFAIRAVPAASRHAPSEADEIDLDPDAEDPPDLLEGDVVDLGAYVVEHLALEIDPFPRKPGVAFEAPPAPAEASPFAVLRNLKPGGDRS